MLDHHMRPVSAAGHHVWHHTAKIVRDLFFVQEADVMRRLKGKVNGLPTTDFRTHGARRRVVSLRWAETAITCCGLARHYELSAFDFCLDAICQFVSTHAF